MNYITRQQETTPARTWEEVADEYNKRNPAEQTPMTRKHAFMIHKRAMEKLKAIIGTAPELFDNAEEHHA